jgi:hypothetical protein
MAKPGVMTTISPLLAVLVLLLAGLLDGIFWIITLRRCRRQREAWPPRRVVGVHEGEGVPF